MIRVVRTLGYVAYLLGFVLLVDYVFFWRPFVAELRGLHAEELPARRHVPVETMRRLGALRGDRTSSFTAYEARKGAGVVRLCAFGDSFTYGDEVADGHDYPALLQRTFFERGITNLEVLNFGNSWYGFHQAYVVWHDVGRRFDCDVILLGPDCFQPDRDTTFNHTGLAYPYYLHARYVLDDSVQDGVRLVEVMGDSAARRFEAYFRFFPHWRYARFDRSAPAALRAPLPRGRTIANPFYYVAEDAQGEAYATYERLLVRMADDSGSILLVHSRADLVAVAARAATQAGDGALTAVHVARTQRFPYSAPGGHYSAFGNRLLAEQYHALLTGRAAVRVIEFVDAVASPERLLLDDAPMARLALSAYRRIAVYLGERRAGFFAVASADPARRGGSAGDLAGSGVAALVGVRAPGTPMVDAAFVPVTRPLAAADDVELRIGEGTDARTLVRARLRTVAGGGNVGVVDIAGVRFDGDLVIDAAATQSDAVAVGEGERISLVVAGEVVATGLLRHGSVSLQPLIGDLRNLRAGEGDYAELPAEDLSASLDLVLERDDGTRDRAPIALLRSRSEPIATPSRVPLLATDGAYVRVRRGVARAERGEP